jgi:hypothetical protein
MPEDLFFDGKLVENQAQSWEIYLAILSSLIQLDIWSTPSSSNN